VKARAVWFHYASSQPPFAVDRFVVIAEALSPGGTRSGRWEPVSVLPVSRRSVSPPRTVEPTRVAVSTRPELAVADPDAAMDSMAAAIVSRIRESLTFVPSSISMTFDLVVGSPQLGHVRRWARSCRGGGAPQHFVGRLHPAPPSDLVRPTGSPISPGLHASLEEHEKTVCGSRPHVDPAGIREGSHSRTHGRRHSGANKGRGEPAADREGATPTGTSSVLDGRWNENPCRSAARRACTHSDCRHEGSEGNREPARCEPRRRKLESMSRRSERLSPRVGVILFRGPVRRHPEARLR